jgi:hypothetical protein
MRLASLALLFALSIQNAGNAECVNASGYDLSTPGSALNALMEIRPDHDDAAITGIFYDRESAPVIIDYDREGAGALREFASFRSAIRRLFENRVISETERRIQVDISSVPNESKYVSFSLNASSISAQLRTFRKGDISLLEKTGSDDAPALTVLIRGRKKQMTMVRESGCYRMHIEKTDLESMKTLTAMLREMGALFRGYNERLQKNELTAENRNATLEMWAAECLSTVNKYQLGRKEAKQ